MAQDKELSSIQLVLLGKPLIHVMNICSKVQSWTDSLVSRLALQRLQGTTSASSLKVKLNYGLLHLFIPISSINYVRFLVMLDQIPLATFSKLAFSVPDTEDLLLCGGLEFYGRSFDRVMPKNERRLERFKNGDFFKVTTTDDHVIRRLANEDQVKVFATDAVLATLMCVPRSVYWWDIVVQRAGNKLFFDKRDGSQLDLLSVHEFDSKYSGVDWRQKLETQRCAVLANELKNHPRDRFNYVILAIAGYKPREFATQINLNIDTNSCFLGVDQNFLSLFHDFV